MNNIKLTSYSSGAGWACKINPKDLGKILEKLSKHSPLLSDNIGGYQTSDDCSIYPINDEQLLIQSVDFFTPIVDNPYDFGRIAAANALSDIYAMGGKPIFALNITCFPTDDLPMGVLHEILKGGNNIAKKAGIPILGGHSIKDKEPKYGLVVTGIVNKKQLLKNSSAKINDVLILTKPIGTGIISTAIKKGLAIKKDITNITNSMISLNENAANAMKKIKINACTDITGYGLLGHAIEMCKSSNVKAILNFENIPFIENTYNFAQKNIIPGGTKKNLSCFESDIKFSNYIDDTQKLMLADAQTSGGLLISVPYKNSQKLIKELEKEKCLTNQIIGTIVEKKSTETIEIK